ncbi:MAG: N-acyl homoserine lactonase family protein [Rhizobiaceae bacterium]
MAQTKERFPIEPFELFAIRYAWSGGRKLYDNFIAFDLHDDPSSSLDYFVWVARRSDKVFLIDTGFGLDAAKARRKDLYSLPKDALAHLGIKAEQIEDVILTHLHYDHAGTMGDFPKARFHLQDRDGSYATGRCMCHQTLRFPFDVEDIVTYVRLLYSGRFCFHDGVENLADGLSVHLIGGHTAGLQVVRVFTRRGWVVVASDATHFYANMREGKPFPAVYNIGDMLEGHKTIVRLADSEDHVIPGHDPLVTKLYPPPTPELEGIVMRLDVPPRVL